MLPEDKMLLKTLLEDGERPIVRALVLGYASAWQAAQGAETLPQRRHNTGRRAANLWIRNEVEKLRHQEPEAVRQYRQLLAQGEPRCCHTCDRYDQDGNCTEHQMQPPADFAGTIPTPCEDWHPEIPF